MKRNGIILLTCCTAFYYCSLGNTRQTLSLATQEVEDGTEPGNTAQLSPSSQNPLIENRKQRDVSLRNPLVENRKQRNASLENPPIENRKQRDASLANPVEENRKQCGRSSESRLDDTKTPAARERRLAKSRSFSSEPEDAGAGAPLYNYSYVASLLRARGYDVHESGQDMPVAVLENDVAVPAEVLLPDLFPPTGRSTSTMVQDTWKDKDKEKTVIYYFYDQASMPNQKLFEDAARAWSSSTCITFQKTNDKSCTQKVSRPSFCVGNFGGCWSFVGRSDWGGEETGSGKPQKLSVSYVCELDACIHEFGHGLGFMHQQSRPDRDQFLTVNYENFKMDSGADWETKLRSTWYQGTICAEKQVQDIPAPYDFLSVMQYGTFDFVDSDIRPTFVTKKVEHQWMLDYHRSMGRGPSHYDYYIMNSAYGCTAVNEKQCKANGKNIPKCTNYGYLAKDCTCKCAEGYSGSTCKEKDESFDMYHLLEKAECSLTWHYPGIIDIANLDLDFKKRAYVNDNFNYMQFCTIVVDTKKKQMRPILQLDPSELLVRRKHLMSLLRRSEYQIVPQMYLFDCRQFYKLFWTANASQPLLRTECFSSVFNLGSTVTPAKMLTLRGKTPVLSMYFNVMYKWSTPALEYVEASIKLRIAVTFSEIVDAVLERKEDFAGPHWKRSTGTAPTIPAELRYVSTTPNIFGIPLPSVFRDTAHPKLSFFAWVTFILGVLACTFFAGALVADRTNKRAMRAERKAADKEDRRIVLPAITRYVHPGADKDDERGKKEEEEEEEGGKENWIMRVFGIKESSSSSEEDEGKDSTKKRKEATNQRAPAKPASRKPGPPNKGGAGSSGGKQQQQRQPTTGTGRHLWQPPAGPLR